MNFKNLMLFSLSIFAFVGCERDEDEQENINTVRIDIKDGATAVGSFTWSDPDGAGGNAPRIDTIRLAPNKTYSADIRFLNAAVTPNEDYTQEIKDEGTAHQLIFTPSSTNLTVNNLSNDANGKPLGLTANFVTTTANLGSLRIVLKHDLDKNSPATTGETDADVTLPFVIR